MRTLVAVLVALGGALAALAWFVVHRAGPGEAADSNPADIPAVEDVRVDPPTPEASHRGEVAAAPAREPRLAGQVVDREGRPIAGATIAVRPANADEGLVPQRYRTDAEGRFAVLLPRATPHVVATGHASYEPFDPPLRELLCQPGDDAIRIVLQRKPHTTFRVVDAVSGLPLEEFGLEIVRGRGRLPDGGSIYLPSMREPAIARHAGGSLELPAVPIVDGFILRTRGYAAKEASVAWDDPNVPLQTVRVELGASIVGRVADELTSRAQVALERARLDVPPDSERNTDFERQFDLSTFAGRVQVASPQPDGSFEFHELAGGTYRIELSTDEGDRASLERVLVEAGAHVDVGAIMLAPRARLHGRVRMPRELSPKGLAIFVRRGEDERSAEVDAEGLYAFEGIGAGEWQMWTRSLPKTLVAEFRQSVELEAGEDRELDLDLTALGGRELALTIVVDGRPAEGVEVLWGDEMLEPWGARFAPTDALGCTRAFVAPISKPRVVLASREHLPLGAHPLELVPDSRDGDVAVVSVATSALALRWPDLELPPDARASVYFDTTKPIGAHGPLVFAPDAVAAWSARGELDLGRVGPGHHRLTVDFFFVAEGPVPERGPWIGTADTRDGERELVVLKLGRR